MANVNLNETRIAGNIGKITAFTTPGGMLIVTINIAVTTYKKVGDDFENKSDWFTVKAFGKLAEKIEKNNCIGDNIYVSGRLSTGSYEKDGVKHNTMEIITDKIVTLSYGKNNDKRSDNNYVHNDTDPNKIANDRYNGKGKTQQDEFAWDGDETDAPF